MAQKGFPRVAKCALLPSIPANHFLFDVSCHGILPNVCGGKLGLVMCAHMHTQRGKVLYICLFYIVKYFLHHFVQLFKNQSMQSNPKNVLHMT